MPCRIRYWLSTRGCESCCHNNICSLVSIPCKYLEVKMLHLLVRILYACITVASRLTRSCTLRYSHTRRPCLHRSTQCPRIASVCIASEELPAGGTRISARCRIYHTAAIDTEAIAIAADLGRVAGTWHRAVGFWRRKTLWQAVVAITFGAILKTLRRRLDFYCNRGSSNVVMLTQ
jgi:hypothetical protein